MTNRRVATRTGHCATSARLMNMSRRGARGAELTPEAKLHEPV
jgi:hypothetical protein